MCAVEHANQAPIPSSVSYADSACPLHRCWDDTYTSDRCCQQYDGQSLLTLTSTTTGTQCVDAAHR